MFGFKVWQVKGESMSPSIPHGSFVVTFKNFAWWRFVTGQSLVLKHHKYGMIVKRLVGFDGYGQLWCQGNSKASISVQQMGPISKEQVIGQVLWVFKPKLIK